MECKGYTCSLNKVAYLWPTQSTQSVKTVVCLRKRSHNWFSPRFCGKNTVRITWRHKLTQRWVIWSTQWFPKYRSKPKQGWLKVKKWALPRQSQPELCIFNVTTVVFFGSAGSLGTWEEWNADIKNEFSNSLPKPPIQSLFFHKLFEAWVVVCGVFTKHRIG